MGKHWSVLFYLDGVSAVTGVLNERKELILGCVGEDPQQTRITAYVSIVATLALFFETKRSWFGQMRGSQTPK